MLLYALLSRKNITDKYMLTNLKIKKLFGMFDYDLSFSSSPDDKIRFITAPNGYGKSTILKLIDGIFNQHFDVFFKIPFEEIVFTVDGAEVHINQTVEPVDVDDEGSDAEDKEDAFCVVFSFGTSYKSNNTKLTLDDVNNKGVEFDSVLQQIEMFFSSEKCKYIDDCRLLRGKDYSSELVRLSDIVKTQLEHIDAEIEKKISVLREIVDRSDFVNKHMELNPKFGFRFIAENEAHTKLAMSDLSSGEKHILLITLYMLFDAPEKALVLIDEPEMSFHLSWQGDYLKNLQQIVALRNVQCIIATHSPHVFNSDWNKSVDLYDLVYPEENI